MVTVSDLTPVGRHFEARATDEDWMVSRPADGNRDGMVTVSDITPIGQNYEAQCSGYTVLTAGDPEGTLTEIGEILFDAAVEDSRPPLFEFTIPAGVQDWLLVRPFDSAGNPGELCRSRRRRRHPALPGGPG